MPRLHVITSFSNPARYKSRHKLYNEFSARLKASGVALYTIELASEDQNFAVTESSDPLHFQVRSRHVLWFKENLLNIAIGRLPSDWEYVAWLDADVSFVRADWVNETIQKLQKHDFVQLFSHVVDLGPRFEPLTCDPGFVYQYLVGKEGIGSSPPTSGSPGYAWAARRGALESVGGLIDWSIMGSNDYYMALGLIGRIDPSSTRMPDSNYAAMLMAWQAKCEKHIRRNIGYIDTTLLHYWHGKRKDRGYETRLRVLSDNQFDPSRDLAKDSQGLWELTDAKPALRKAIIAYFQSRNEDSLDTN